MKDKIIKKQKEIIKIQDKIINHYINRPEMYFEEFSKKLDKLETIYLKLESELAALEAEQDEKIIDCNFDYNGEDIINKKLAKLIDEEYCHCDNQRIIKYCNSCCRPIKQPKAGAEDSQKPELSAEEIHEIKIQLSRIRKDRPNPRDVNPYRARKRR